MAAAATDAALAQPKKKLNKLIVEDTTDEDNTIACISPELCEMLDLFRGDTVMVKGKRNKSTVMVVMDYAEEFGAECKVKLNKVARKNLRVKLGDTITLNPCKNVKFGNRIHVLP